MVTIPMGAPSLKLTNGGKSKHIKLNRIKLTFLHKRESAYLMTDAKQDREDALMPT
jgi:hypothetical protein